MDRFFIPNSTLRILTFCTAVIVLSGFCLAVDSQPASAPALLLSSPVSHSDWMLHNPAPQWGEAGVRRILDRCKEAGIRRVYWRCCDGGRAMYASRLMEPEHGFDADNYHVGKDSAWVLQALRKFDYNTFDTFAPAIRYGHQIGLEVYAWLTINEDDHGWGLQSRFTGENSATRWVKRDGTVCKSQQSFAFASVREYKLGLVREVLAYRPDGIFFDWIRTGDVRDNPHTDANGIALYGYESPNVEAFQKQYHVDPHTLPNDDMRWVRVRAQPQTVFMREAAGLIRRDRPGLPIIALVQQPWGYRGGPNDTPYRDSLSGLLVDVKQWAAENLVDDMIPAGYYRDGGDSVKAYRWLEQAMDGKSRVGVYGWLNTAANVNDALRVAREVHTRELLLWESDYLGLPPEHADVLKTLQSTGSP